MPESKLRDNSLFETFRKYRREEDFRQLYRIHTPVLYRVAYRFINGNYRQVEEIVQETWCRAVKNIDRFEGQSSLRTWLTGITINCCREYNREKSRMVNKDNKMAESGISNRLQTKMDLESGIGQLADGYREILVLHDVEGFTHREISEMLDISEGTSKSQLSRARAKVREYLTNDNQFETG